MLIDCHALKDGGAHSHKMAAPSSLSPARQARLLCVPASRVPQSPNPPSRPGPAQNAGKPQMAAAQPPRAARVSGGNWQVSITTSDLPNAGTSSQVYIILYGQRRSSAPIYLYGTDGAQFQDGHENIFTIMVGDIGTLFKIRIGHTNSGISPSWHCKQIQLWDMNSGKKFYIPVQRWLARDQEDGEICREFPVLNRGQPTLPVTVYEVHVATGELWNSGTVANVYISIYGKKGDTGSRQLFRSKSSISFLREQTDTFSLEAVHLGDLYKIVIGHDGLGPGNGWFLDDVVIKDPTTNHEYAFFCHRGPVHEFVHLEGNYEP
ncbi:hypothetical protein QTO34_007703 [Cnephaeus nilssonii]|uniref:PLAT domain-containing protein n=1 Tax=Cnephaeus nilssonii TaxID=3371016 RepID=A0AA40LHM8_CNENI|nr:hypothetical protein QTO34_007703 [Eptesicus nilssonii]